MEGLRSAFSTSSSTATYSNACTGDQNQDVEAEDIRNSRAVPEAVQAEPGPAVGRGAVCQEGQPHHQMTPSKRRTVLNISPPPLDLLDDSRMSCQDEATLDSEQSSSMWLDDSLSSFSVMSTASYNDNTEVPRKSRKRTPRQRPGPKAAEGASVDVFDADSAKGPHFVLSQLGSDGKAGPKGRLVWHPGLPVILSVSPEWGGVGQCA